MCDFIPQELWLATSLPKQTPFIASALFRAFDFETQKQGREREKLWQCCKLRERTWKRRLSQNNTTSGGRRKKVFRRRTLLPDIKACRMSVFPTSWLPFACLKSLVSEVLWYNKFTSYFNLWTSFNKLKDVNRLRSVLTDLKTDVYLPGLGWWNAPP